jgi:hypothetical protein
MGLFVGASIRQRQQNPQNQCERSNGQKVQLAIMAMPIIDKLMLFELKECPIHANRWTTNGPA